MTEDPPAQPTNVGQPRAPGGRKTKLNRFLITQAETLLDRAIPQEAVCEILGIGKSTWWKWLQEAEKPGAKPLLVEFREAVARSRARAEAALVEKVLEATRGSSVTSKTGRVYEQPGDWRAAAFILERNYPQRWAAKRSVEVGKDDPVSKEIDLHDIRKIREEVEEAGARKRKPGSGGGG